VDAGRRRRCGEGKRSPFGRMLGGAATLGASGHPQQILSIRALFCPGHGKPSILSMGTIEGLSVYPAPKFGMHYSLQGIYGSSQRATNEELAVDTI